MKFEFDSFNEYMSSFEKKIESIETRLTYSSDRDDDIWKMSEGLSQKIQLQSKTIADLEAKLHEMELSRMADETSRAEFLNASFPNNKEMENILRSVEDKLHNIENRVAKNEDRAKRLEAHTQSSNSDPNIERRFEQIENDVREELDKILEQIEVAKNDVKIDIAEDFITIDHLRTIEQQLKQIKTGSNEIKVSVSLNLLLNRTSLTE